MKKVLIIGVGSIGHRHLRVFNSTGRVDMAICETNAQLRQEIAERYGIQEAHSTLEEALVSPPDLAVICTPAHLHIPMAIQLATAGVDILIEKPLAISTQQISLLQEIVDQKELICGVAYVMRHHPVMRDILEIIETARFGTPLQYTLTSGQHFPHYRPAYRDIYYTSHATGGGAIQDALTHMMNAAHWLFGPATSLLCDASHLALQDVTVEDTVHALTRHGKLMGSLTLNQFQAPNESTLQINFERCSIRAEFHRNQWRQCDHPEGEWHGGATYELERDGLFTMQATSFLDCVENRSVTSCTLQEGLQTLHTNLAMLESWKSRKWVQLSIPTEKGAK